MCRDEANEQRGRIQPSLREGPRKDRSWDVLARVLLANLTGRSCLKWLVYFNSSQASVDGRDGLPLWNIFFLILWWKLCFKVLDFRPERGCMCFVRLAAAGQLSSLRFVKCMTEKVSHKTAIFGADLTNSLYYFHCQIGGVKTWREKCSLISDETRWWEE